MGEFDDVMRILGGLALLGLLVHVLVWLSQPENVDALERAVDEAEERVRRERECRCCCKACRCRDGRAR